MITEMQNMHFILDFFIGTFVRCLSAPKKSLIKQSQEKQSLALETGVLFLDTM